MNSSITIDARMLEHSGIGTYLRGLIGKWGGHASQITLITSPGLNASCGVNTLRLRTSGARIYSLREQYDLWRFSGEGSFWSPHWNVPVLSPRRLMVTIHDVLHLARPDFFPQWHKQAYARAMLGVVRKNARRIICVSEFTKRELMKHARIEERRIAVIPNGVDEAWFVPPGGDREYPGRYLLFVGSVKPTKNLKRLLRAFAIAAKKIGHDLVAVGRKEGLITVDREALAAAEALGTRVRFTGRVGETALRRYYRDADALLFPSLYEGFGLPPLEAMASGTPVLASDIPALREVCGNAALYCDPLSVEDMAEKMVHVALLSSRDRAEWLQRGSARARLFGWEHAAAKTWEVLQS